MKQLQLANNQELIIHRAKPEDAPRILAFLDQISIESEYLTFGRGEFGITLEQEIKFIEALSRSDNQLMICAFLDDTVVAQLSFSGGSRPRTRHTGEFGVSVMKKYWRLGIATELIKYMLEWARDTRIIRKVNLRVRSDHEGAIRLYESLGFTYEGTTTREFCITSTFYDSIHMGLEID